MKKVMIYAYTHFNLGDDLFIKILCERYPHVQFLLYAPNGYKQVFKSHKNITIIPSDFIIFKGINFLFRKFGLHNNFIRSLVARNADAMVYIGGSLFIQTKDWRQNLRNTKSMQLSDKPFFLLGANFGPYHDHEFYEKHKGIFATYRDICFRDSYSYQLFKDDLSNVRKADDIVYLLENEDTIKQTQSDHTIVISIIKPSIREELSNKDELYYEKVKELIIHFINNNYHVTLMSFCEYEQDHEAIDIILKLLPNNYAQKVTKHLYLANIDETLKVIANSTFVVATRFHAMLLGWIYQKPVFPIVYSNKMLHVMRDLNFNGDYVDFNTLPTMQPETVLNSIQANTIDITKNVKNAEKQFKKLDEYLL